jgi:hypothetical protein
MYPYTTNVAPCAIILSPSRDPNVAPLYLLRTSQPEMAAIRHSEVFYRPAFGVPARETFIHALIVAWRDGLNQAQPQWLLALGAGPEVERSHRRITCWSVHCYRLTRQSKPKPLTAAMIAMEITAAIAAYAIAVSPDSSATNLRKFRGIGGRC